MESEKMNLYAPFRVVGLCSTAVPLSISAKGTSVLIATSVGRSFNVYEGQKLHLLFTSCEQDNDINLLIQDRSCTIACCGPFIRYYKRGTRLIWSHEDDSEIVLAVLIGQCLVFTNACNVLRTMNVRSQEMYSKIKFDEANFRVSTLLHPSTYLNKILIGSHQGPLQLWNINTGKLIYTFTGWGSSVLSLEQSPALDIIGIGLADGRTILHNIRENVTLATYSQDLPVTRISFRTDGVNTMITGSSKSGSLNVWNLDHKRIECMMNDVHSDSVDGAVFLPNQPLLITSSQDNSIKMWIFDQSDGSARLLKERRGHSAPPTIIRFISPSVIISGGLEGAVRVTALHKDSQSREMSQGSLNKSKKARSKTAAKLPQISSLSFESIRSNEWDCIVSCHHGNRSAFTWSLSRYSIGSHRLTPSRPEATPLSCCVSHCGNYCVVGASNGDIEVFNIQSGIRRKTILNGHRGPVRGVCMNICGDKIYSCGADGFIKVWLYSDSTMINSIELQSSCAKMCYHSNSSLLAVASDHCSIMIVDVDTVTVVRKFNGHSKQITDMCFSSDGRWLISCSMDCSIITWDLPSGRVIDKLIIEAPPTSLSLSNNGEYLAYSVADEIGIYIRSNTSLYDTSTANATTITDSDSTTTPLSKQLVTLSGLAKPQWINITDLDIIKERNKPVDPVQQVEPAPFFIPKTDNLPLLPTKEDNRLSSQIIQLQELDSVLQQHLVKCREDIEGNIDVLTKAFKSIGPSQVDKEIQLISNEAQSTGLLNFLLAKLRTGEDFDLVESYLSLYLKYHKLAQFTDNELLKEILEEHKKQWSILDKHFNTCLCLLTYCKHCTV